jgi:2-polyprenyl-6-methoxyphenol hydroxylase-like FAD-dependent oxidoreductase
MRFDAIIAGGGPTGMLTGLLAHRAGFKVAIAELRGVEATRPRLVRLTGDTRRLVEQAGAARGLLPPLDTRLPPNGAGVWVQIRDYENALRAAAAEQGVPTWYNTVFDDVGVGLHHVDASLRTEGGVRSVPVRAGVLFNTTGGRMGSENALGVDLVQQGVSKLAMSAAFPDAPAPSQALATAIDGSAGFTAVPVVVRLGDDASFLGAHQPGRGVSGTIELRRELDRTERQAVVNDVSRQLGADPALADVTEFEFSPQLARKVRAGRFANLGDSAGRISYELGRGLNMGALDAYDAVNLLNALDRTGPMTGSPQLIRMQLERVASNFDRNVRGRHRDASDWNVFMDREGPDAGFKRLYLFPAR